MKKRYSAVLISICIILMTFISNAEEVNLVHNAKFEEYTSDQIVGWEKNIGNSKYSVIKVDEKAEGINKEGALLINNNIEDFSHVSQTIRVEPNSYYKISAYTKVKGVRKSGAYIMVKIFSDLLSEKSNMITGTSCGWEKIELYGKTNEEQNFIVIGLCLGESGTQTPGKAWFDNVVVEKLDYVPNLYVNLYTDKINTNSVQILVDMFAKIGAVIIITCVIYIMIKRSKFEKSYSIHENFLITKKDVLIMLSMTSIYFVIAFINLGDLKVPESGWFPSEAGEYVTIELPKKVELGRITYFEGMGEQKYGKGMYNIEYQKDDGEFSCTDKDDNIYIIKKYGFDNLKWNYIELDNVVTNKIKFVVNEVGMELKEIGIYEKDSKVPIKNLKIIDKKTSFGDVGSPENIIDEQGVVAYSEDHKNSGIFDEVCYPRTSYEYLNGLKGFEDTHPPLGKIFTALGIKIFGLNPFGWRIMGMLFGVAMIPAMYLLGKKLLGGYIYPFAVAFLMMFDCMHFTQTRISLIDSYSVFFIILMYYYMIDVYMKKSYELGTNKYLKNLILSGVFFSLGVGCKWIAVYGGAGLAVMFFVSRYREYIEYKQAITEEEKPNWTQDFYKNSIIKPMICGILCFVILPIIVYLIIYIPVLNGSDGGYTLLGVIEEIKQMFSFHKNVSLSHPYASKWYEWPVMYRPMKYFYTSKDNSILQVIAFGNPIIWWISPIAVIFTALIGIKKRDKLVWPIILGYIFQYLPWIFIARTTFIYHYFSAIPFAILAIIYIFKNLIEDNKNIKYVLATYLSTVLIIFVLLYPFAAGIYVTQGYINFIKYICIIMLAWVYYFLYKCIKRFQTIKSTDNEVFDVQKNI